ncbi:hypothetical protein E2C01_089965 [Portunus trituberculatus]|uniref:Uncharacterized protein n=1 Tax=Portunus trituberculatus TaxID=210409 RepID=A0A5B7JDF8_PORTR|nr:hypothetical protein [Portunus trituberculatus]
MKISDTTTCTSGTPGGPTAARLHAHLTTYPCHAPSCRAACFVASLVSVFPSLLHTTSSSPSSPYSSFCTSFSSSFVSVSFKRVTGFKPRRASMTWP